MKGIVNGRIITEEQILEGKVLLFNNKIVEIIEQSEIEKYNEQFGNMDLIDAKGNYVSPGFIDIHIHGAGGFDTMDGEAEYLTHISKTICKNGVTAFLPTTMTMEKTYIFKALDSIREARDKEKFGAKILGVHLEGPFINEKHKGAQKEENIIVPSYNLIKEYTDVIKIITLAPEKDFEHKFIKQVKENTDIVLSIGHSNAAYDEAIEAIHNGVEHATHTFNAMTALNHREPGIVGAVLNSDVSCEIIADNIHIHPAVYNIVSKVKNKEKIVLITDSMRAGGMEEGVYDLGGQDVIVKNNSARLANGTLAGSILTLNEAVKNMFENTGLKMYEAVAMASLNPAKVLRIDNIKGSLSKGKDADVTIFDDNFNIYTTIVEGKIVFNKILGGTKDV